MEQPLPLTPSPAEIRQELQDLIIGDLLGPAGGEDEEIPGRERVRDRYVLGALAPKDTGAVDPERSSSDHAVEGDDSLGTGDADPAAGGRSLFPSSMGFSCAVDVSVESLVATATWGTYEKVASEATDGERASSVWRRSSGRRVDQAAARFRDDRSAGPGSQSARGGHPGPGDDAGVTSAHLGLPRERAADAAPEPGRGMAVPGRAPPCGIGRFRRLPRPRRACPRDRGLRPGAPAARHALPRRGRVRRGARDGRSRAGRSPPTRDGRRWWSQPRRPCTTSRGPRLRPATRSPSSSASCST